MVWRLETQPAGTLLAGIGSWLQTGGECPWLHAPQLQVSHVLAKPIESLCGYLTVLPGAFSAFRWAAIEVGVRGGCLLPARTKRGRW